MLTEKDVERMRIKLDCRGNVSVYIYEKEGVPTVFPPGLYILVPILPYEGDSLTDDGYTIKERIHVIGNIPEYCQNTGRDALAVLTHKRVD